MTPKQASRAARRAAGLCIECGAEAMKGSPLCGYHDEVAEERLKALQERKKHGCRRCGKPPVPGMKHCQRHLDEMKRRQRKRMEVAA